MSGMTTLGVGDALVSPYLSASASVGLLVVVAGDAAEASVDASDAEGDASEDAAEDAAAGERTGGQQWDQQRGQRFAK